MILKKINAVEENSLSLVCNWVLGFGKKEIKFSCECGVAVEAGGRCGLMEAVCVRGSDRGSV